MRTLVRGELSEEAYADLERLQAQVDASPDPPTKAKALWRSDRAELRPVRSALNVMSSGRLRCMYCEDNEGVDIDHFWPKARFPHRAFQWSNYLLACPICNSNYKRARFPRSAQSGDPLLIDPTVDDPADHLVLTLTDGRFVANTAKGVFSQSVFQLNRESLRMGRRDVWTRLRELLPIYAACRREDEHERADRLEEALRNESFSAVRLAMVRIAHSPAAELLLPAGVRDALAERPEIAGWP